MYTYHDTPVRLERERQGNDHCASNGPVFDLISLVNTEGKAVDPRNPGELLDNSNGPRIIYAVSSELVVHIAFDGIRGAADAVKHETLFHNANVEAAGEVSFRMGRVSGINDHSGSYRTFGMLASDLKFRRALRFAFSRAGVLMVPSVKKTLRMQRW
ncbi:MAG TPA: hypothetical protein VGQ46_07450 [Thermoanaerobaculia bacterium]|jgi:hypothetical protein|nr:hypothetical protein [Thermoanaerobaculia bacterium]